jgi:hypothetical protein
MEETRAAEGLRFAAATTADPSSAVRLWRVLTGRRVVGCPLTFPAPEIFHSVGLLPVIVRDAEERRRLEPLVDEWAAIQGAFPKGLEGALDWVESIASLAEALSGEPCTDGAVERSMRLFRRRDRLAKQLEERAGSPGLTETGALRDVIESGRFLPVEAHTVLLEWVLGKEPGTDADGPGEEPGGDPFLLLARRVLNESVRKGDQA